MGDGADAAPADAVIEVRGIRTRFGEAVVHDSVDLTVQAGEVFALVGGSGSGKSTLLREIISLQQPKSGSIRVFGQEVVGLSDEGALPLRRRWGVMFERGALFSALTVAENVGMVLEEHTDLPPHLVREVERSALGGDPGAAHHGGEHAARGLVVHGRERGLDLVQVLELREELDVGQLGAAGEELADEAQLGEEVVDGRRRRRGPQRRRGVVLADAGGRLRQAHSQRLIQELVRELSCEGIERGGVRAAQHDRERTGAQLSHGVAPPLGHRTVSGRR